MSDMNVVCLCGRLTKDPELRITQSGQGVCSFTVACNRNKRQDEEEAKADFLSCVAWNKTADYLVKYGQKGERVQVTGRLQSRSYDDKDGKKVYVTEILVNEVNVIQDRKQDSGSNYMRTGNSWTKDDISRTIREEKEAGFDSDDVPF